MEDFTEGGRGKYLAKAALAKTNVVQVSVTGDYEQDRQKFLAMSQALGITFDSNNNVLGNVIKADTDINTTSILDHENRISDLESDNTISKADIVDHESRITSLESVTGFTGTIEVVTGVDFVNQTTETKTVTVQDGIVVGVV